MRVLITENSRFYRQLLDKLLGQQGFETDVCRILITAKAFVDAETYDIIFANRHLEDCAGLELIEYYGHAVGDIVLEAVGKLLKTNFREGDLVARFGGEEFVILLNNYASDDAQLIAENTREKMEALKPHNLVVTPSMGLTSLDIGEIGDFESMFSIADEGVYAAKEYGQNQVVFKKP